MPAFAQDTFQAAVDEGEHCRYGLGIAGDWEEFGRFDKRLSYIKRYLIGHQVSR